MISSIVFIVVQMAGKIDTSNLAVFWKIYVPACFLEIVIFFNILLKWGRNNDR